MVPAFRLLEPILIRFRTGRIFQAGVFATALILASCSANIPGEGAQAPEASSSELGDQQLDSVTPASAEPWLVELNRLRATGGLKPVAENAQLTRDCRAHAQYLVEQGPSSPVEFVNYERTLGLGAHHEDKKSPHYTAAGAECAKGGKLTPGVSQSNDVSFSRNPIEDMDGLFYDAPFHRFSMLASWATVAGYGSYGESPRRAAALSLRGVGGIGSPLKRFPTDGSTVPIGIVHSLEIPDPLASCPGYRLPVGLPITLQLGSGYRGNMSSFSVQGPAGALETCGFDWNSYQNSDGATQEHARDTLKRFGGIILIPRKALADGRYTVSVVTTRESFTWTFTVANQPPPPMSADTE